MLRKRQYRIPTLLGLVILLIALVSGVYLVENFPQILGQAASLGIFPQDVRVSKITDSSLALSFLTSEETPGIVKYGTQGSLNQTAYDVRDKKKLPGAYKTHYLEITGLAKESKVSYEIVSGGKVFSQEKVILAPSLIEMPQTLPVYGKIAPLALPEKGAIVYLSLEGASLWSSFLSESENWVIPLAAIRTKSLDGYYCQRNTCHEETKIRLEFYSEEKRSEVVTTMGAARPFPETIVLGKNYYNLSPSPVLGTTAQKGVEVLAPEEGGGTVFSKPLIRGLGVPGEEILITLDSTERQTGKVKVKTDGTWLWTPVNNLSPGKHTLTIITRDDKGNKVTLNRHFSVFKSGERVLAGATLSATLTPTAIPTTVPTSTPLPTGSPTPSLVAPTPTPTLPPSGFLLPSLLLLGSGFSLLLLGLTFF